jgi:hypothetical protein
LLERAAQEGEAASTATAYRQALHERRGRKKEALRGGRGAGFAASFQRYGLFQLIFSSGSGRGALATCWILSLWERQRGAFYTGVLSTVLRLWPNHMFFHDFLESLLSSRSNQREGPPAMPQQFTVTLTDEQAEALRQLAAHWRESLEETLRRVVKEALTSQ